MQFLRHRRFPGSLTGVSAADRRRVPPPVAPSPTQPLPVVRLKSTDRKIDLCALPGFGCPQAVRRWLREGCLRNRSGCSRPPPRHRPFQAATVSRTEGPRVTVYYFYLWTPTSGRRSSGLHLWPVADKVWSRPRMAKAKPPDWDRVHRAVQRVRRHRRPRRMRPSATVSGRAPSACSSSAGCRCRCAGPSRRDAGYWWELSMAQVRCPHPGAHQPATPAASLRRWSPTT